MSGRAQKIAAAMAATLVVVSGAHAAEIAGATVRDRSGWSASLFVSPPPDRAVDTVAVPPIVPPPVVNATISRRIAKGLRLSFDVTNVFDRPFPSDDYLFQPAEPRGFRLRLRKTF